MDGIGRGWGEKIVSLGGERGEGFRHEKHKKHRGGFS